MTDKLHVDGTIAAANIVIELRAENDRLRTLLDNAPLTTPTGYSRRQLWEAWKEGRMSASSPDPAMQAFNKWLLGPMGENHPIEDLPDEMDELVDGLMDHLPDGTPSTAEGIVDAVAALALEVDAHRDASTPAFDEIVKLCGLAKTWEYPAQVIRDVEDAIKQRDAKIADQQRVIDVLSDERTKDLHVMSRQGKVIEELREKVRIAEAVRDDARRASAIDIEQRRRAIAAMVEQADRFDEAVAARRSSETANKHYAALISAQEKRVSKVDRENTALRSAVRHLWNSWGQAEGLGQPEWYIRPRSEDPDEDECDSRKHKPTPQIIEVIREVVGSSCEHVFVEPDGRPLDVCRHCGIERCPWISSLGPARCRHAVDHDGLHEYWHQPFSHGSWHLSCQDDDHTFVGDSCRECGWPVDVDAHRKMIVSQLDNDAIARDGKVVSPTGPRPVGGLRKLERGEGVELLVRVKATVIDRASGHGRCYELRLDQRDFTAETNRTVWIDDAEIEEIVVVSSEPLPSASVGWPFQLSWYDPAQDADILDGGQCACSPKYRELAPGTHAAYCPLSGMPLSDGRKRWRCNKCNMTFRAAVGDVTPINRCIQCGGNTTEGIDA